MIKYERVFFSRHAVTRMFERSIRTDDVMQVLEQGEIIAEYPEDDPFPNCLVYGFVR